nr:hypothetical protein CFP56_03868 [Quercus suber]
MTVTKAAMLSILKFDGKSIVVQEELWNSTYTLLSTRTIQCLVVNLRTISRIVYAQVRTFARLLSLSILRETYTGETEAEPEIESGDETGASTSTFSTHAGKAEHMAPRLNHRKCDEVKPSCSACTRHNVRCEYVVPSFGQHRSSNNTSVSSPDGRSYTPASNTNTEHRTPRVTCLSQSPNGAICTSISAEYESASLELRLLHYYLLYTSASFSIADEMWRHRIPLVAYQNRSVFDGILALAAGHLYREAIQAGDDRNADVSRPQPTYRKVTVDHRAFLAGKNPRDMRKISQDYFQACVRNHRQALADRLHRDYEAAYISSVIILCYSLFTLGEEDDNNISDNSDEILWFTLAIGPRQIVVEWQQSLAGIDVLRYWGQFDQQPDLSDEEELFRPSHAEPWSALLLWATEYENISPQDQRAYERTMAFIGLIYKFIILCYSLFTLGEEDDNNISDNSDEILWFTLAIGPRQIVVEWQQSLAGIDVLRYWGQFDQQPDLSDEEELFRPSHAEPWSALLLWATEYENISPQDQRAYERTMAFIGLIYKCIVNHTEPATATCRRIVALPARVPRAFTDMVLRRQPRALIILAHVFGMMKAMEGEIIWFRGTPEKQIRHIHEKLPTGWKKAMQWPLKTLVAPHEDGLVLPRPPTMEQIMAG